MKIYKDFPLVNSFNILSDVLKNSVSVVLISAFFGDFKLGLYAFTLRILQTPLTTIGSAFAQVLFQKMNELKNKQLSIIPLVRKNILILFLIGLPIFGGLYFISPWLFGFVLGSSWSVAGEYTILLLPYLYSGFLIAPFADLPIVLNKQKKYFIISFIGNFSFVFMIYIFHNQGIEATLRWASLVMTAYNLFILSWFLVALKKAEGLHNKNLEKK